MSIRHIQKSKIDRLSRLLHGTLLIDKDRDFVRDLIQKLGIATVNTISNSAYAGLELLLDQDKITRAKVSRRFAAKKVDLFKQNLDRFTSKEFVAIAEACHLIQMTDGCTVACSWCYLSAQPYIHYAISFDSIRRFIKKSAQLLPDPTRFYWASDPLDWYDGERSYLDLVVEFYKASNKKNSLVTTTSLPMGTEITFLRFIQWCDNNLQFRQSTSFVGNEQHYLKDNVMKGLYYRQPRSYDMHSLFDYYIKNLFYNQYARHVLKISETDVNYKRLEAIFDILRFMGISQSCLSWIEIETRDKGGFDGIRKSGRAYSWSNRRTLIDSVSMACWDSAIVFPGKVGAMEMCGVTSKTQRGLEFWLLDPGKIVVPQERAITIRPYFYGAGGEKQYLLPYAEMKEYTYGILSRQWTHYSLRRDIQAYGLLLSKVIPAMEYIAQQTHIDMSDFSLWQDIEKQYIKRKTISDSLKSDEKDLEVIRLVSFLTKGIEEKLLL